MPRNDVSSETLAALYTVEHLTMAELGARYNMTRSAVQRRLKRIGVTREQGTWVNRTCGHCGTALRVRRQHFRRSRVSYCHAVCYYAHLEAQSTYRPWRNGQRVARAAVAPFFALTPEQVVHHVDGDNHNNALANLAVYASQGDHMKHHRGGRATPLWEGATAWQAASPEAIAAVWRRGISIAFGAVAFAVRRQRAVEWARHLAKVRERRARRAGAVKGF